MLAALLLMALAQSNLPDPEIVANHVVDYEPWDMAITPDGSKAIVHAVSFTAAASSRTYVISLDSPYEILWDSSTLSPNTDSLYGMGRVAAIDGYMVACSMNAGTGEGLVRILHYTSDTNAVSLAGQFTMWDDQYGWAPTNNVHALWDGNGVPTAVIKTRSNIYVYNMSGPTSLRWWDTFPNPINTILHCELHCEYTSDAVAVTPSRVVTIANGGHSYLTGPGQVAWPHGWVGISNLLGVPGQTRIAQQGFGCNPVTGQGCPTTPCNTNPGGWRSHLHDVEVTPSNMQAVVSGWGVVGVYHLPTGVELKKWDDALNTYPRMGMLAGPLTNRHTRNSVAVTDKYAVIIGHDEATDPSPSVSDPSRYRVVVAKLDPSADPENPNWTNSSMELGPVWQGTAQAGRAHDIRITPNQQLAVVSIREPGTLVLSLTGRDAHDNPPLYYPTDVDPLDFTPSSPTFDAWIAQSVDVSDTRAVVIGRDSNGIGAINIIDLTMSPIADSVTKINIGASGTGNNYLPTDVSMAPTGNRCLVRSVRMEDPPTPPVRNPLGDPAGGKITVIDPLGKVVRVCLAGLSSQAPVLSEA